MTESAWPKDLVAAARSTSSSGAVAINGDVIAVGSASGAIYIHP